MDFNLKFTMSEQELFEFGEKSVQKELNTEDYIGKREENLALTSDQLNEAYKKPLVMTKPIERDMPQNDPEEKESKRIRRQKKRLAEQGKQVNKEHRTKKDFNTRREEYVRDTGKLDKTSRDTFEETLRPEEFAPKYVLEHFKEIRQKLDMWKEHLRVFGEEGAGAACLKRDQQIRIEKMRTMYTDGERALESALAALGFQCETKRNGELKITELNDPEGIQRALEENVSSRKKLQEQENIDEKVAEQLITEEVKNFKNSPEGEGVRNDSKYSFIQSEHMSQPYHLDVVKTVKDLLESHPEKYRENKAVLDSMYQEVFNLMEVLAEYSLSVSVAESEYTKSALTGVRTALNKIRGKYDDKHAKLVMRTDCIIAGIKNILMGEPMDEKQSLVAREFIKPEDAREQRQVAENNAAAYANIYRDKQTLFNETAIEMYGEEAAKKITAGKNGRYMMLMEANEHEHNAEVLKFVLAKKDLKIFKRGGGEAAKEAEKEVGRMAKTLILPYMMKMWDFDTKDLENYSDEELMSHSEELQQLYISGMQIVDIGKYKDPDDPQGRSIKEAFLEGRKEEFTLKCSIIQAYAVKARMLTMVEAYRHGSLTKECFIPTEPEEIKRSLGLSEQDELGMNHMLVFVKDNLQKSEAQKDAAYNKYFRTDSAKKLVMGNGERLESSHKNYDAKMTAVQHAVELNFGHTKPEDIEEFYRSHKEKIKEIDKELADKTNVQNEVRIAELQEKRKSLTEEMEYLTNWYALKLNDYKLAGDTRKLIKEPIFRSYASVDQYDSFRNMGEENFTAMCRQLAAGALEIATGSATKEEIEAYRQENVKGLMTYKKHMREHYEMLEERFHHKVPSLEYIVTHYDEMQRLFANGQVDANLVTHSNDMIDMRKEEDARLYHLVIAYYAIGGYVQFVCNNATHRDMDYRQAMEDAGYVLKADSFAFEYLSQKHNPVTEKEKTEAEKNAELVEKYRRLTSATRDYKQRDVQSKWGIEAQVQEFKKYLQEHAEESSQQMNMFRRWNKTIDKALK